jgi:CheY-like chemotaxis protein
VLHEGKYVCLLVSDSGEGMSPDVLARATEPFFTTKGIGKGTGLGLSMVQGFAEQSGGALVLHSVSGQGTTAQICFPAVVADEAAVEHAYHHAPHARSEDRVGPLRILVVDDDALVLMNTVAMLEDLGHTVSSAMSAQEALHFLGKAQFDLLITDHAMPQITGTQLAAEARARWPQLLIMLATGYAELPLDMATDLPRLAKPFSQADLAEAVDVVVGDRTRRV